MGRNDEEYLDLPPEVEVVRDLPAVTAAPATRVPAVQIDDALVKNIEGRVEAYKQFCTSVVRLTQPKHWVGRQDRPHEPAWGAAHHEPLQPDAHGAYAAHLQYRQASGQYDAHAHHEAPLWADDAEAIRYANAMADRA